MLNKQNNNMFRDDELILSFNNGDHDIPPEHIARSVNPWRKSMNMVLAGLALSTITLNFLNLNYILPALGILLLLLGFRALKKENSWFTACYYLTVLRSLLYYPSLLLNATVYYEKATGSAWLICVSAIIIILIFVTVICLGNGFKTTQTNAGLEPHAGGIAALNIWYIFICLLALTNYSGIVIGIAVLISYIFILRSLYRLSKELEDAGYSIKVSPIRISNKAIVITAIVIMTIGIVCCYLFINKYPMEWQLKEVTEHDEVTDIKAELIDLGFPENILDDLSADDIKICRGALDIFITDELHPVNDGRIVRESSESGWVYNTVYDTKELKITSIALLLPGEREQWKIFHYFEWVKPITFFGTEALHIRPDYPGQGWLPANEYSGRLLYNKDDQTYVSSYHTLGLETIKTNDVFFGVQNSTDIIAAFSMPNKGDIHRGYVSYCVKELQEGWMISSWINYIHQKTPLQYPVITAKGHRRSTFWSNEGAFRAIQDAIQFRPGKESSK